MRNLLAFLILALLAVFLIPSAQAAPTKMVAVILLMDNDDDQQIIQTIYTSLMAAEKVAKVLNIEMIAQDEVSDDVFVFSLKTEEQKNLTMKMFDEEGYELAAHRVLQVNEGQSYRALNVESMKDGTYTFQLSDESGAEITKRVSIKRAK